MANEDRKPELKFDATPEEIRALYDKLKREFTLEDLKAFDVEEKDTIPFSTLVAELEEIRDKSRRGHE